jgi:hypothetical protein
VDAVKLNVRNAVRFFGGPVQLSRRFDASDSVLTVKAIEKWQERGGIPGIWIVRLVELARTEGRKFEVEDFIERKGENSGHVE